MTSLFFRRAGIFVDVGTQDWALARARNAATGTAESASHGMPAHRPDAREGV
jgi:hypothetical protein